MNQYKGTIRRIVSLIDKYCEEGNLHKELPNMKEIAKFEDVGVTTLRREFVKARGVPIYELYLSKKMAVAKRMLRNEPGLSIEALSARFGYKKVNNFIDIFRKYYGTTPGKLKVRQR